MRFYLGFSKKIKVKTLIEILGFIFVGLCAYFGILQHAYADSYTNINITSASFFSLPTIKYLSGEDDFTEPYSVMVNMYKESGQKRFWFKTSNAKYEYQPYAFTSGFESTSSNYWYPNRQTQDNTFDITNNNYCTNSTSSLKSMNLQFFLSASTTLKHDYEFFNQSNIDNLFDIVIQAWTDVNDDNAVPYNTTCTKTRVDSGQSTTTGDYLISCNNFFQGNSDITITKFRIDIMNSIPFNDRYADNASNYGIVFRWEINEKTYDNSTFVMRYSCSDDAPILDNGPGHGDDDPAGLDDIYNRIKEHYKEDIGGIDPNAFLRVPGKFSDLLNLPFALIRAVINNTSTTCSPYELDFSNLVNINGGSNTYKVQLPCMRTKLSSLLGNWYNIIDLLICFYLFYDISMHIISFITAIINGQDLYYYFFKASSDNASPDNLTGGEK